MPEKYKVIDRAKNLKREYGISLDDYNRILLRQNGVCANSACSAKRSKNGHRLCVDHDHETGEVRGLLCFSCNVSLGHMRDDIGRLAGLISYLENWRR